MNKITQNQFLEPVSPSKFFQNKPQIQETRFVQFNESLRNVEVTEFKDSNPNDQYNLDQLRDMLEMTRQDLDKMNLNSSFLTCQSSQPQPHKVQQPSKIKYKILQNLSAMSKLVRILSLFHSSRGFIMIRMMIPNPGH